MIDELCSRKVIFTPLGSRAPLCLRNPEYFLEEKIVRHVKARAVLLSKDGEHQVTDDNASF